MHSRGSLGVPHAGVIRLPCYKIYNPTTPVYSLALTLSTDDFPHKKKRDFPPWRTKGSPIGPTFCRHPPHAAGDNCDVPWELLRGFLLMWNNSSQECNPPRASDPCPHGMSLTWLSIGMIISNKIGFCWKHQTRLTRPWKNGVSFYCSLLVVQVLKSWSMYQPVSSSLPNGRPSKPSGICNFNKNNHSIYRDW